MKKKLIFCISIILCLVICASAIPSSAYIVECPVNLTSRAVLVANLDTDTFVCERNSTGIRYLSHLTNIMTYIIARNGVKDLDEKVKIKKNVLDKVEDPDNTLDKFTGKTLTVRDLLHYVMLTDGKDACYVLADYVCKGDIKEFVRLMNKKALTLGCEKTNFERPYNLMEKTHYTTCVDMYKIIKCALDTPDYTDIASKKEYTPEGYDEEKYTINTTNSLLKPTSPYYFKYIENGKYAIDSVARGNVAVVSYYDKVRYVCIIFGAQNENEHNAYTETKQLLSWAYMTLANVKLYSDTTVLSTASISTDWGNFDINLTTGEDVVKTMPADYDDDLLVYETNDDIKVELPVFKGQNMGSAKIYYNKVFFDEVNLVSDSSHGIGMFSDIGNFLETAAKDTLNIKDDEKAEDETQKPTEKTKKSSKSKKNKSQQATQAVQ